LIAEAEERYQRVKANAEEREMYAKEAEEEEKKIKKAFGETGLIEYNEEAMNIINTMKPRKVVVRK
jgi:hypothetical protein